MVYNEYKQLIIYLNDVHDKEAHTVVMNKDTPLGKYGSDVILFPDEKKHQLKRIVPDNLIRLRISFQINLLV